MISSVTGEQEGRVAADLHAENFKLRLANAIVKHDHALIWVALTRRPGQPIEVRCSTVNRLARKTLWP